MANKEGRRLGFKVSDETKQKTQQSNPNRRPVNTPFGQFASIGQAARELNLDSRSIKYYIDMNIVQQNSPDRQFTKDYSQWSFVDPNQIVKSKRAVNTPLGQFESLRAAAEAHGVTPAAVHHKLRRKVEGYSYAD